MLIKDVSKLQPVERLTYWIKERHNIFLRRRAGQQKPWTDDEVLRNYFFTNPYRENDKVTRWFRENVREPLRDQKEVLFATICFRWFNWPPTGNLLMSIKDAKTVWSFPGARRAGYGLLTDWDTAAAVGYLGAARDSGNQIFTGAFNISNSGSTKPKINRVCEDYIQPSWEACNAEDGWACQDMVRGAYEGKMGMQDAHELLMELPGMGGSGFMAYEVVCDLRYTKYLEHAADKLTWSNPGPGARRGLNRLLEKDLDTPVPKALWAAESRRLLKMAQNLLPRMPPLEMREVEHSLCEYDKYERARLGVGHLKRRYSGV